MWTQALEQNGYAVIPDVLDARDLMQVIEALSPVSRSGKAGIRHILTCPAVSALASDSRLLAIAQKILGDGAFPFHATLFDKSPRANWLVAWHQDTALPLRQRREIPGWGPWSVKHGVVYSHAPASALERVLALRAHLDDSTIGNGPLRVLPGTHLAGILSDDTIHRLASEVEAVACLVPAGGIVAMRPAIVHASSKSQSQVPRRVLHIEYAAAHMIADGLELAIA